MPQSVVVGVPYPSVPGLHFCAAHVASFIFSTVMPSNVLCLHSHLMLQRLPVDMTYSVCVACLAADNCLLSVQICGRARPEASNLWERIDFARARWQAFVARSGKPRECCHFHERCA